MNEPIHIVIFPVNDNKRVRLQCDQTHLVRPLIAGLRFTQHNAGGYWEGNFNMRSLYHIFVRAKNKPDLYKLSLHPEVVSRFKAWNGKRVELLQIKKQDDTTLSEYFRAKDLWQFQRPDVEFFVAAEKAYNANDMGLGKTIETAATIDIWRQRQPDKMRHILIICKRQAMMQWKDELVTWSHLTRDQILLADDTRGDKLMSILIAQHEAYDGVLIIAWDTLRLPGCDKALTSFNWDCIIADEIHKVRNTKTGRSENFLKTKADKKLALTGTSVVNKGYDMFVIVNWLLPDQYDSQPVFTEDFVEKPKRLIRQLTAEGYTTKEVDALDLELDYVMVRHEKRDVKKDIPGKVVTQVPIILNPQQRELYNLMRDEWMVQLEGEDDEIINSTIVLTHILRLKQLAVSPALLKMPSGRFEYSDIKKLDDSAKLDWIDDLLDSVGEKKVVIFSQFETATRLIESRVQQTTRYKDKPYGICMLTGKRQSILRPDKTLDYFKHAKEITDIFNYDTETGLFLSTLQTGGDSINLTGSSTVTFPDFWWNSATHEQAEDRLDRGGQVEVVNAYRLVAADTVEEDIISLIGDKKYEFDQMVRSRKLLLELLKKDKARG